MQTQIEAAITEKSNRRAELANQAATALAEALQLRSDLVAGRCDARQVSQVKRHNTLGTSYGG